MYATLGEHGLRWFDEYYAHLSANEATINNIQYMKNYNIIATRQSPSKPKQTWYKLQALHGIFQKEDILVRPIRHMEWSLGHNMHFAELYIEPSLYEIMNFLLGVAIKDRDYYSWAVQIIQCRSGVDG